MLFALANLILAARPSLAVWLWFIKYRVGLLRQALFFFWPFLLFIVRYCLNKTSPYIMISRKNWSAPGYIIYVSPSVYHTCKPMILKTVVDNDRSLTCLHIRFGSFQRQLMFWVPLCHPAYQNDKHDNMLRRQMRRITQVTRIKSLSTVALLILFEICLPQMPPKMPPPIICTSDMSSNSGVVPVMIVEIKLAAWLKRIM